MAKETQAERILKVLQEKNGEWVNGRYFVQTMMITQFHTRIFELQKRGHDIQASPFTDEFGFKSYKLLSPALTMPREESGKEWWTDPKYKKPEIVEEKSVSKLF